MSGAAILLFFLSYCQMYAYGEIQPPQELNIAVPILGRVHLTWKHSATKKTHNIIYQVNISTPDWTDVILAYRNQSTQEMIVLHGGFTARVAAQGNVASIGEVSTWLSKSLPPYSGVAGTSASDLTCRIYIGVSEECTLSCSWAPGEAAPADTEYNLYYRYGNVIERCQDYITEAGGQRRIGCSVLSTVLSAKHLQHILVHINGTSKSLEIKAMEKVFLSSDIVMLPPVQNLELDVHGLHWMKPIQELQDHCLHYQVNLWLQSRNETIIVRSSSYLDENLKKLANGQIIRIRAVGEPVCGLENSCSEWTAITIPEDVDRSDIIRIALSVCLILVFILQFLLCIRFWKHVFPQIPKPKNDLKEGLQNIQSQALMRFNSWDNTEVISYIEEILEPDKYKMSSDYGHLAVLPPVDCVTSDSGS